MCDRKIIPKNNQTVIKKNSSTRNLLLLVNENKKNTEVNKRKPITPSCFVKSIATTSYVPAYVTSSAAAATKKTPTGEITGWSKKLNHNSNHRRMEPIEKKKYFHTERARKTPTHLPVREGGGYVKSQVQMITTSNSQATTTPHLEPVPRRFSSDAIPKKDILQKKNYDDFLKPIETRLERAQQPPVPKPSKSTPLAMATKSTPSTAVSVITATKKKTSIEHKESSIAYNNIEANRKSSLKKMGSCAIPVVNDDGTSALYALGRSIGKGQFGEVFGGLNMDTGEYVAIKRIKRNQMDCDDMNEVGLLKHLNSEHIVRYVGFSKDNEYLNIILEYAEMGSLYNNIKSFGKFPEKLAASYTYKILSGLHYLHSKDVIHCDLKAGNILTTKTGSLKLTDFGVSLSLKMKDDENTGEPAGTPNWMAPEVIKFAGASAKSDIWSLGCTIVEMMTGKPPYAGMPSFAALYKIVEDDQPPIPKNMILSDDAREFLVACFQKNPEDRPSAYDLMKFKWMEPYFTQGEQLAQQQQPQPQQGFLSVPEKPLKKSKSDPMIELSDSETLNDSTDFQSHDFGDEVTYQLGEKCQGCNVQMKRQTFKRCQECNLNFHSQCIYKALPCSRGYNLPQNVIKLNSSSSSNSNNSGKELQSKKAKFVTPLAPLNSFANNIKKKYLPVHQKQHHKAEGYTSQIKGFNHPKTNTSSLMT
ncbi:unnamed protein product [Mucor hiemalis]